jgi:hypothetical protein
MNTHDEHDDDLEPEVIDGAEMETESYGDVEDLDEIENRDDGDDDQDDDQNEGENEGEGGEL